LDPNQFRLDQHAAQRLKADSRKGRRASPVSGRFIAGPINAAWVIQAAPLGVKALLLGVVLWHLKGLRKSNSFIVSNVTAREWGITPDAKSRGLLKLERAGLIGVQRRGKRSPQVTLLPANVSAAAGADHQHKNRTEPGGR
jgi:hypothetical protein